MKTWKKVIIIVLVVLLAALAALYFWQRENIHALTKALTTDSQAIAADLEELRSAHLDALSESAQVNISVKPVTIQQSEDLLDGKVSPEEVKQEMGFTPDPVVQNASREDLVNQCIAELYAYKADVMGYLGGLKQEALNEWNALDKAQRTSTKKMEIGMAGLNKCYAYEAEVDGRVQEILATYRAKMAEIGEDSSPIDTLWVQYCDEKEAEKSYYLGKYLN